MLLFNVDKKAYIYFYPTFIFNILITLFGYYFICHATYFYKHYSKKEFMGFRKLPNVFMDERKVKNFWS